MIDLIKFSRYGFFGLDPEVPKSNALEYIGVALTLVSAIGFAMVKPAEQVHSQSDDAPAKEPVSTKLKILYVIGLL